MTILVETSQVAPKTRVVKLSKTSTHIHLQTHQAQLLAAAGHTLCIRYTGRPVPRVASLPRWLSPLTRLHRPASFLTSGTRVMPLLEVHAQRGMDALGLTRARRLGVAQRRGPHPVQQWGLLLAPRGTAMRPLAERRERIANTDFSCSARLRRTPHFSTSPVWRTAACHTARHGTQAATAGPRMGLVSKILTVLKRPYQRADLFRCLKGVVTTGPNDLVPGIPRPGTTSPLGSLVIRTQDCIGRP